MLIKTIRVFLASQPKLPRIRCGLYGLANVFQRIRGFPLADFVRSELSGVAGGNQAVFAQTLQTDYI